MGRVWRPWLVALSGLASACSDGGRLRDPPEPPELPRPQTPEPSRREVVLAARLLDSLPLGMGAAELCASLAQDRGEANEVERNRLALLQSAARVEATIGELVPATGAAPFAAAVHIERVWFGPWFLEGVDTSVVIPAAEIEAFEPGRYLLGMSAPFPPHDSSDGRGVWQEVKAWIPIARRAPYEDLLGYSVPSSARAAVVEITHVDQASATAYVHVLEALAGEVPKQFTVDWDAKNRALSFPFAGPAPYVMTFSAADAFVGSRGSFSDFRPWAGSASESVHQGLAAPLPVAEAGALTGWVEAYRTAWAFHVAPQVVASRVSGVGYTASQEAYLSHEITSDFKASVGVSHLVLTGDARQLEDPFAGPQCGDSFLMALDGVEQLSPGPPELDAACPRSIDLAELDLAASTADANVHVQLPDTERGREQVAHWLQAPDPVYLLSAATGPQEPAALTADAFWSQTPSLEQTLAVAKLQLITVQSVTRRGELTEVTLELPVPTGVPEQLRRLTARCLDPRLLREGSSWLAPVVSDETGYRDWDGPPAPAFIVPGWLFPPARPR